MTPRIWILALALALVFSNLAWLFGALDRAVTLDYARQEQRHLRESLDLLRLIAVDLLSWEPGQSNADAIRQIRRQYTGHIVKEEGDYLFVDEIGLRFSDGRVVEIVLMNEAR